MKYDVTEPIKCLMTHSTWYQGAVDDSVPVGILWHDTAAKNANIKRYVQPYETDSNYNDMIKLLGKNASKNDWNHAARNAGVNAFVGKLADGSVASVQVGEWNMAPWGCGHAAKGSCNGYIYDNKGNQVWVRKHWLQFEICDDGYSSKDYFAKVFEEACQLTAFFCKKFNIDPIGTVEFAGVKVPTILCHQDSYRLGLGCDHSDVLKWFKKFGKTMDDVRNRVKEILNPAAVFNKGDIVKIVGETYYSGKKVPAWVRGQNWVVYSAPAGSDRIVVDENEKGTSHIMSPFNAASLQLVKPAPTPSVIEVGDLVKITGTKYYSGKSIPAWVKKLNWYVKSAPAGSDRIVIDESEDGKSHICSPVNRNDLQIVKKHK